MKSAIKKLIFSFYLAINRTLGPVVERLISPLGSRRPTEGAVPIFIIGAPRSGTTLTFQLIVHSFRVGYFTNLHCMFFGAPALVSRFMQKRDRPMEFSSNYGRTAGRYGPSECGEWWYRFFRRQPVYVTRKDVHPRSLTAFRRSLASVVAAEKRPVVFKNLYAAMRLDPIVNMFPDAVFIHVKRNLTDNALSILEGRMAANGRYDTWWSVPPPGVQSLLNNSPARQVTSQIFLIDECIEKDVLRLNLKNRVLEARYEDICQSPANFLADFQEFMKARGVDLDVAERPPEKFEPKGKHKVPEEILSEILSISEGQANAR